MRERDDGGWTYTLGRDPALRQLRVGGPRQKTELEVCDLNPEFGARQ